MRALLIAWREDVDTPMTQLLVQQTQQQQQQTPVRYTPITLYQRFVALCGGHTLRSEVSVLARRDTLKSMWTFVTTFNREQQYQQQQSWFALPEWEKRMAFAKAQVTSHGLLDISRDTFQELEQIMASRRRQLERERKRAANASQSTVIEETWRLSATADGNAPVDPAAVRKEIEPSDSVPSQVDAPAEDSGSSTESDDDFIIVDELPTARGPPVGRERCIPTQLAQPSPASAKLQGFEPRNAARPPSDNGWRPILTHKNKRSKSTAATSLKVSSPARLWSAQTPKPREATKSFEPVTAAKLGDDLNTWLEKERPVSSPSHKTTANFVPTSQRDALNMSPSPHKGPASNIGDRASALTADVIPTVTSVATNSEKPVTSGERELAQLRYINDLNTWLEKEQRTKSPSHTPVTDCVVTSLCEGRNPSPRPLASASSNVGNVLKHTAELEAEADLKRTQPPVKILPTVSPASVRGPSDDVADRLEAQAAQLQSVFTAFQALTQADATLTNQFLAEVQSDMADRERVREQVRRLEEHIKSERDEWAAERVRLKQEWEERQLRTDGSQ